MRVGNAASCADIAFLQAANGATTELSGGRGNSCAQGELFPAIQAFGGSARRAEGEDGSQGRGNRARGRHRTLSQRVAPAWLSVVTRHQARRSGPPGSRSSGPEARVGSAGLPVVRP